MHLQILVKIPNVKFKDNPCAVSLAVAYGQTGNRNDEDNMRFSQVLCLLKYSMGQRPS
jgi:hypothetical protein